MSRRDRWSLRLDPRLRELVLTSPCTPNDLCRIPFVAVPAQHAFFSGVRELGTPFTGGFHVWAALRRIL